MVLGHRSAWPGRTKEIVSALLCLSIILVPPVFPSLTTPVTPRSTIRFPSVFENFPRPGPPYASIASCKACSLQLVA
ncbi:Protein Limb Expression 1-like [Manis pentadactyla]|nr:Protein Limb Expression 1-like [Manis pentadactyla]